MPKLKNEKITSDDLSEYLKSYSDFSFELSVLKMLRTSGIDCEHGGHYEDPVTNKSREFDIRAKITIERYRVRMAIECKNIRENFPILISCVPRDAKESYHQIALVKKRKAESYAIADSLHQARVTTMRIQQPHSLYKVGEPVGKSTAQVGRAMDGTIFTNDSELYEKWGQCLSSANDLARRMYWDGDDEEISYSALFPFVVVPNGRLWMVTYDNDGNSTTDPLQTDRCSCYIDKDYEIGTTPIGVPTWLWLSHIEIVTFKGMKEFVQNHLTTLEWVEKIFSRKGIIEGHQRLIKR